MKFKREGRVGIWSLDYQLMLSKMCILIKYQICHESSLSAFSYTTWSIAYISVVVTVSCLQHAKSATNDTC